MLPIYKSKDNLMKNKLYKTVIFILSLTLAGNLFAGDTLKYGNSPDFPQSKLDNDVLEFYEKWKGDSDIEGATEPKPEGDGYLCTYKDAPAGELYYLIKGGAKGNEPYSWSNDEGLEAASTSEATGFGMITFALMADKDLNAQKYFDGLMNLYLRNLSSVKTPDGSRQLRTMSWIVPNKYKRTDNGQQPEVTTSATDGDLDIAYALLLADKVWETPSSYALTDKSYMDLAILLINDIKDYLISPQTSRVLMGDDFYRKTTGTWSSTNHNNKYNHSSTRSSDWLVGHLRAFNTVVPSSKWSLAINEIYRVLSMVSNSTTGLTPDFIEDNEAGIPCPANKSLTKTELDDEKKPVSYNYFLEEWRDDMYGQNACRVPFRIAADYIHYGTEGAHSLLTKISNWSATLAPRKLRGEGPGKMVEKDGVIVKHTGWEYEYEYNWWLDKDLYAMSTYPNHVSVCYTLDGQPLDKLYDEFGREVQHPDSEYWMTINPYKPTHFITPIGFANVVEGGSKNRLKEAWTAAANNFIGDHTSADYPYSFYFGDSITMLNMLLVSGKWHNPVEKNFRNTKKNKWYGNLQTAINEAGDNQTIEIYIQNYETFGTCALIKNKTGLTIKVATDDGAVRVAKSVFQGNDGNGVVIRNSSNITIENIRFNEFYKALEIDENCEDITIDGIVTHNNLYGTRAEISGKNIEIKNSYFNGGWWSTNSPVTIKTIENLLFHHNAVQNTQTGACIDVTLAGTAKGYMKFYNNTIRGGWKGITLYKGHSIIKNNLFSNGHLKDITTSHGATAELDYNLYFSTDDNLWGVTAGPNKVVGNPKLNNGNDLLLTTGSPAIDAGLKISGINDKVSDGKPDIGWKEFSNAVAAATYWNSSKVYLDGDRAIRNGKKYIAIWDNRGEVPGVKEFPYGPWKQIQTYPSEVFYDSYNWGTGSWWNYYDSSTAYSTMYNEYGVLRTDIYDGGENVWDVHIAREVSLTQGKFYTVVFDAKTEKTVKIQVAACMGEEPYTPYSGYQKIELSPDMREYSFTFRMDHPSDWNAVLEFDLGGEETPQDIWIDNVRLIQE